ncbi:hypothetical protein MBLNU230_g7126t1 [Neophaeotheca triangularis]
MRLLYWTGSTYAFKDVDGPREEKYAILSHRWFARGEDILLADVLAGREDASVKHKKGWTKLDYGMQQAKKDGFEFIWIDTCCIDKKISSELDEAINSMYRWYQEAAVCYAYLWDVKCPDSPRQDLSCRDLEMTEHKTEAHLRGFAKSVWFTRGWTLQELIAPQEVQFFGSEWCPLGSRKDRVEEITGITGIDVEVLEHRRSPDQYSIAQRMSWAAKRQTGREEDEAYCLLGFFDVSMPMLYGVRRKAFRKLQLEIIAHSTDQSILAWTPVAGKQVVPGQLFADSPADFAGCGRIERTLSNSAFERAFRSDNRGITGRFPVQYPSDGGDCLLLLNCETGGQSIALRIARLLPAKAGGSSGDSWNDDRVEEAIAIEHDSKGGRRIVPITNARPTRIQQAVLLESLGERSLYLWKYSGPVRLEVHRMDEEDKDRLKLQEIHRASGPLSPRIALSDWSRHSPLCDYLTSPIHSDNVMSFLVRRGESIWETASQLHIAFKIDHVSLPFTEALVAPDPEFDGALVILPTDVTLRSLLPRKEKKGVLQHSFTIVNEVTMAPHPSTGRENGSKGPPARPVRILVTGFGPFQDLFPINPSYEITKTLPHYLPITPSHSTPVQILSHYNPIRVAYANVHSQIPPLLSTHIGCIDLVLHIGMASGRRHYTMEKYGHRDGYDRNPDLDGCCVPTGQSSSEFADCEGLMTTSLDYDEVFDRWRSYLLDKPGFSPVLDGVDARKSENAGFYLCDYTYFNSLAWFSRREREEGIQGRPVMFLHVPAESDEVMLERGRLVATALIRAMADSFTQGGREFGMGEQRVDGMLLSGSRGPTVA